MSDSLVDALLEEEPVVLSSKREIHIAIRRDGDPNWAPGQPLLGNASASDPLDGSTASKLDYILRVLYPLTNVRFVFGSGIFRTTGTLGWVPLNNQEFIGAGINQTTLRLEIPAPTTNEAIYNAISNSVQTEALTVADMTIDGNMQNQPNTPGFDYPKCGCGALWSFKASHVRFRRVRVINCGTRCNTQDGGNLGLHSGNDVPFTIYDSVVEDCMPVSVLPNDTCTCTGVWSAINPNSPQTQK